LCSGLIANRTNRREALLFLHPETHYSSPPTPEVKNAQSCNATSSVHVCGTRIKQWYREANQIARTKENIQKALSPDLHCKTRPIVTMLWFRIRYMLIRKGQLVAAPYLSVCSDLSVYIASTFLFCLMTLCSGFRLQLGYVTFYGK
jgi:hypothetical protein